MIVYDVKAESAFLSFIILGFEEVQFDLSVPEKASEIVSEVSETTTETKEEKADPNKKGLKDKLNQLSKVLFSRVQPIPLYSLNSVRNPLKIARS